MVRRGRRVLRRREGPGAGAGVMAGINPVVRSGLWPVKREAAQICGFAAVYPTRPFILSGKPQTY